MNSPMLSGFCPICIQIIYTISSKTVDLITNFTKRIDYFYCNINESGNDL